MSTILHRIRGDEYIDAVAFVADIQVLSHHSSRYSVINIQVLCAHLPWYSVLIFLGTPCSSSLALCAHLPWYSVLLFLGTVLILLGAPCSSCLVLCAHLPWYSVLILLGTLCSSSLVLRAHLPWYSVLIFPGNFPRNSSYSLTAVQLLFANTMVGFSEDRAVCEDVKHFMDDTPCSIILGTPYSPIFGSPCLPIFGTPGSTIAVLHAHPSVLRAHPSHEFKLTHARIYKNGARHLAQASSVVMPVAQDPITSLRFGSGTFFSCHSTHFFF